ncbi:MAG: hypothetical protein JXB49_03115 [Bacteroidales bacterium]|nr:hypothetical protein [Bacteroidales bacterium]
MKPNAKQSNPKSKNSIKGVVTIEGDISINNIDSLMKKLKAIKPINGLKVQLFNITQYDLAGAQLLVAFYKSCKKKNIELQFDLRLPDDLNLLNINAGINKIFTNLNTLKF